MGDYTFYCINDENLTLDAAESMQFGHTLERFLRELILTKPALGTLFLAKTDMCDDFYRIDLAQSDVQKLGLTFHHVSKSINPDDQLVTIPLVILIGWKNSSRCSPQLMRR